MSRLSKISSSDAAFAAMTPLMDERTESATSPSSSSRKITRKDGNKGGRERRNSFAGPVTIDIEASLKKQMAQMEQDAKDIKIGYCTRFGQVIVKTIHLIDATIGLVFLVYGSLIMSQFDNPAMDAAITSLTFGSIMMCSSILGVIGFTTKLCKRCGLLLSAYTALLIVCFYAFVMIAVLAMPDVIFDYLTEHMSELYLNTAQIQTLRNLLPLFYIIMASLSVVEVMRFFAMKAVRNKLVRFDGAFRRMSTYGGISKDDSIRSGSLRSGSVRSSSIRSNSMRSSLTEPLIEDEEGGSSK